MVRYNEDNCTPKSFFDRALQGFPGVLTVEEDTQVLQLMRAQQEGGAAHTEGGEAQRNVKLLHAPELWAKGAKGKGVVVASIDSGVRYTHEALRRTFRGKSVEVFSRCFCVS